MRSFRFGVASCLLTTGLALGAVAGGVLWPHLAADPKPYDLAGFRFELEVTLPGTPEEIFDAFTGDVKPWWDHTFSKAPVELVIEPKVGGSFREQYDAIGNGCEHARVTHVHRGQMLRMVGPLGLAGKGVDLEMNFRFAKKGDETLLTLEVYALGKLDANIATIVQAVWKHFLVERFEPYVREGKHRSKGR